jgi:signal transduction histidine kinase
MINGELDKLAALIKRERDGLLCRWRRQVKDLPARHLDTPKLNAQMPEIIDDLAAALQGAPRAPASGLQRMGEGFDIEEVVAEYNVLRGCIQDLALANGLNLQERPLHILNRVLDEAIGLAVKSYAAGRVAATRSRRGEHLAFVANDVRTPLNAIALATNGLELALPARSVSAAHGQMLNSLRRNVSQLDAAVGRELAQDCGAAAQPGLALEKRSFDLWPLVEAMVHDLHRLADAASVRLVNRVPENLVAHADAALLRRVFHDLLANAIADAPHGEVTIGAQQCAEGGVECWVTDNGAGEARDDRLFHSGELAAVAFLEAHGGAVNVEHAENRGSTFRFTLPRPQVAAAPELQGDGHAA